MTDRSLSQEIEFRLDQSFRDEKAKFEEFGGEGKYRFMKLLAAVVGVVEHKTGQEFARDPWTRGQAIVALEQVLKWHKIEAYGEASEEGRGALFGDQPIGKDIGDRAFTKLSAAIESTKSGEPPESDEQRS